jgi:non-heme chloroperoxidase
MSTTQRFIGTASSLVQFFPLSVFATYAFWYGVPTSQRWVSAFQLAAVAAVIQLLILLPRRRPTNRLILGANLYLLVGGAAALAQQWWLLEAYGALKESGIFLFMLGVGVVTTFATSAGFVAVVGAAPERVRRSSLWLLGATLIAFVIALAFQGNRTWAAVVPVIALAVLQRALASRLRSQPTAEDSSPSRAPGSVRRLASVAVVVTTAGIAVRALVGGASPGAGSPTYDETDLVRVDYSGLPAPTMLAARDGAPLAVRVYGASGETVIVAIHGSSGRGRYFHPLARYLSERGAATVYALDLRGHGQSGGRRGDVDYIGQLEDDLADVVTVIRRERPTARIMLLGHSAGGGLAVRYAGGSSRPSVDGYVLLAPYLGPEAATTKPNAGGWALPDLPKIGELSAKATRGDVSGQDAIVLRFNQPAASADPLQVLGYSFRMLVSLAPRRDVSRDLSALRQPLLLLVGARDESFYPEQYEPTVSPHAKGTFTVLPDISHLGLVVNRRTAEVIETWLGRRP